MDTFRDNIKRLAPNEPNLDNLCRCFGEANEALINLSTLSCIQPEIGTYVVDINYYIRTLEATLINWLNLQATEEMRRELANGST